MKQQESVREAIGDYNFYIRPFPAMTAANMTGDLAAVVVPLLSAVMPLLSGVAGENGSSILDADIDMESMGPAVAGAFSTLSGDKLERLMGKLCIDHRNIFYEDIDSTKPELLDKNSLNEIFCGNVQDMFVLAWKVIKINFGGFFDKFASQFGSLSDLAGRLEKIESTATGTSTSPSSTR